MVLWTRYVNFGIFLVKELFVVLISALSLVLAACFVNYNTASSRIPIWTSVKLVTLRYYFSP